MRRCTPQRCAGAPDALPVWAAAWCGLDRVADLGFTILLTLLAIVAANGWLQVHSMTTLT